MRTSRVSVILACMVSTDTIRLADELDALASERETEAKRLREAARVLRGSNPPSLPLPFASAAGSLAVDAYEATQRRGYITEDEYLKVLQAFEPSREWTAEILTNELRKLGKPVASVDAVRTAMVRLNKKGYLARTGHGRYKVLPPTEEAVAGGAAP